MTTALRKQTLEHLPCSALLDMEAVLDDNPDTEAFVDMGFLARVRFQLSAVVQAVVSVPGPLAGSLLDAAVELITSWLTPRRAAASLLLFLPSLIISGNFSFLFSSFSCNFACISCLSTRTFFGLALSASSSANRMAAAF